MARKRYEEEHENHERWLVSYADFITLLFAFFVVMYALSSINQGKYKVFSNSLGTAFGGKLAPPPTVETPQFVLPGIPQSAARRRALEAQRREQEAMARMARDLGAALAPLIKQGKVRVVRIPRGVSVEINASVLFASGDATLGAEADIVLRTVAVLLQRGTHQIQVEGHTDDQPISNALFPSNWELSAVRASSVVRLFIDSGIDGARLTALGHGANRPVAPNGTPEGRARNRRVAVTILSAETAPPPELTPLGPVAPPVARLP